MHSETPQQLSFDILDDVMFLSPQQREDALSNLNVLEIGPLVELITFFDSPPPVDPSNPIVESLAAAQKEGCSPAVHSFIKSFEFTKGPQSENDIGKNEWQSFLLRCQKAANAAGIEISMAKAISATIAEMAENVIWHSESVQSSIVGYQFSNGRFDYVVADGGIGVLNSLRKSAEYCGIQTSSEALLLAVSNGVSRFSDSYRGTGFNSLVLNLAKRSCDIRFRTGNSSLTFEGVRSFQKSAPPESVLRTCSDMKGLVITFSCTVP